MEKRKWKSLSHVQLFATPWTMKSMEFSRPRILEWVAVPSPGDLPNPGIEPRPPALQADSLPAEPLGKPKNTGMGSLSLLQQNFPTQELNLGLLHCRQILYHLSHQGIIELQGKETVFWVLSTPDFLFPVEPGLKLWMKEVDTSPYSHSLN